MDLATVDDTLNRLRATVGAMSTNLVDLENDAGRERLDHAPLTGTTVQRWTEASAALAILWQWFSQLNDIVEKATELRGTKSRVDSETLTKLGWLVTGPSIELSKSDVPLAQRGLFGPTETTIRCSPPELLARMQAAFDEAVAVIGACTQKWGVLDAKLQPLEVQLADAVRLTTELGEQHHPELDQVQAQLDGLRQAVGCDPLAASDDCLDGVALTLGSVTDDLGHLAQLKGGLGVRLVEARSSMGELRAIASAAASAREEAVAKIAHPTVIDPRPRADDIEHQLAGIEAMAARGDWRAAAGALVQWTTRYRDARAEADRALATNRAPLAARNELRGRLDAYQAKAYRLGRLEDPAVAALHARALAVLFTAPTDLDQADQLVRQYQQILTGPSSREVAP